MTELTRLRAQIEAFAPYNEQEEADRRQMLADMDCFSDLLTRENATAHFTASCWIVNPDRTKVLMAYHNLYQSWAWLGGHADGEADLLSVALREAYEESGVLAAPVSPDIFSLEILHVAPHVKRGKFVCAHLHLNATYLLEADDKSPIRCKPDENSAVRWLSMQDVLPSVSEPAMRPVYQKLMEKAARQTRAAGICETAPRCHAMHENGRLYFEGNAGENAPANMKNAPAAIKTGVPAAAGLPGPQERKHSLGRWTSGRNA